MNYRWVKSDKIVAPWPNKIGDARGGEVGDLFALVSASLEGVIQMNYRRFPISCFFREWWRVDAASFCKTAIPARADELQNQSLE